MAHQQKPPMGRQEMYERIRQLVAHEYGVDIEAVGPNDYLDDDLDGRGDDIDIWEFVDSLERQFKVKIPVNTVGTVQELADYIWAQTER